MQHLKIFIELTRLNKPIGYMLLFWPCAWGLAFALTVNQNLKLFLYYLILFFLGSVLMRSAGCIFNDIIDKDFDIKVKRTMFRPITSGAITVKHAFIYVLVLCLLAFFVLIQFNKLTIVIGMGSMVLAFSYPYMKRITYWPQLFLGITFNWGILMAWTAMNNSFSIEIIVLYLAAIFWTLGYDTIYGAQDMSEDEIIGLKSTSIKFKDNIKTFVLLSYSTSIALMIFLFYENFGRNLFSIFTILGFLTLFYQIKMFNKNNPKTCLKIFKLNNFTGLVIFIGIFLTNF